MIPSNEALAAVPKEVWWTLGERLRREGAVTGHERVWSMSEASHPPEYRALRLSLLRAADDGAARLLRAFWLHDPVPWDDLVAVLGAELARALEHAGVLLRESGGGVATLLLSRHEGRALLAEDLSRGGDAVMGVGALTATLVRVGRGERPGRVLDLGCGAGAVAVALARAGAQVVATDVNPRAAIFCAINAAMEGVAVDARSGDMFAAVAGERFDGVLFQPPFVPSRDGSAIYAAGGARGDEIALRAMAACVGHLAPGGRALFAVELPILDNEPLEARIRAVVPADAGVIVIEGADHSADAIALGLATHVDAHFGATFDREFLAQVAHFEAMKLLALRTTLVIVTAPGGARGSGTILAARDDEALGALQARDVDAWIASFDRLAEKDGLARSRLQLRPGVQLARLPDGRCLVHAEERSPLRLEGVGGPVARVVDWLKGGKPVGEVLRREVKDAGQRAAYLEAIAGLLRAGLLEIAR